MQKLKLIAFILSSLLALNSCSKQTIDTKSYENILLKTKTGLLIVDTNNIKDLARSFVIDGSSLQQQGKYAESTIDFMQALRFDNSCAIHFALAKSYKELKRYDLAMEHLLISLELKPKFIPSLDLLGEIYLFKNQFNDAIRIFELITEVEPTYTRKLMLAQLYEYQRPDKATEMYEEFLKVRDDIYILKKVLQNYKVKNNQLKYESTLEKLYNLNPKDFNIALSLLEHRFLLKQYSKINKFFESLDSNYSEADLSQFYGFSSEAYYNINDSLFNPYIVDFLKLVNNRFVFDWKLNLLFGYLSNKMDNYSQRDVFFNQSLKVCDTLSDLPLQIGIFYVQNKQDSLAIEILNNYKLKFPQDFRYQFYLGLAYFEIKNIPKALICYNECIQKDSNFVEVWIQLGLIYDNLGKFDSTEYCYKYALKLDENNPLVNNNYAYALSERNLNLEEAERMSKIAISAEPNNSAYLDTYSWIHFQLSDYDVALEFSLKALSAGFASAEVYEHLGDIYSKLNEINKANEAYVKSINIDPKRSSVIQKINKK